MSKTKRLTEMSVCVAMAVVLSFVKVWEMPRGGSVALTMVPILFIAQRRGVLEGAIVGGIYGIIALLIESKIYHPASIFLDYILAFGALGLAGMLKGTPGKIIAGCVLGTGGRFLCSLISGAVLFAEYAPVGQNPWVYSLIYQATYMLPELAISCVVLLLLHYKAPNILK